MLLQDLYDKKIISPPAWLLTNTSYLTIMGSIAYGCEDTSSKRKSDFDVYGFCIPPKKQVFPHLDGEILGFGTQKQRFEQYLEHQRFDPDALGGKGREYDFTVFSIVKYFQLVMENNPNCIDSLFTPQECVLHMTQVGNMVRENRTLFLHKGCFPKFKGYAFSQLHKMKTKNTEGKRKEIRDEFGFDVKYALHLVRLLSEVEQILVEHDIDLRRNSEQLKAIRRGEMTEEEVLKWASDKERHLEKLYAESTLRPKPDEAAIKTLLLNCLEQHYGSLDDCVSDTNWAKHSLQKIDDILNDIRRKLHA